MVTSKHFFMKSNIVFCLCLVVFGIKINANALDSILVHFDNKYFLPKGNNNGFMSLLNINKGDSIHYDNKSYKLILPEKFFVKDTAVAFNYFTGWKNQAINNVTLFLFGDYTSHKPIVYIDYNHNLDFSDDGQPIVFDQDSTKIVYLKNSENPFGLFPIKFFYQKMRKEEKEEVFNFFSKSGPDVAGNSFVDIDYWLADQRLNYRIARTWINNQKINIVLFDYNCNGLFNDKGQDKIFISDYDNEVTRRASDTNSLDYSDSLQFKIGDQVYRFLEIEPTGRFTILKKSNQKYIKPVDEGDDINNLEIQLISGETKTLKELNQANKYVVFDFWGTWCTGCIQQMPKLHELKESKKDKLQIIGLNFSDELENVKDFLVKHKIDWVNGIASSAIIEKLRVTGFPRYVLIDKNGKIKIMNATIHEISELLD